MNVILRYSTHTRFRCTQFLCGFRLTIQYHCFITAAVKFMSDTELLYSSIFYSNPSLWKLQYISEVMLHATNQQSRNILLNCASEYNLRGDFLWIIAGAENYERTVCDRFQSTVIKGPWKFKILHGTDNLARSTWPKRFGWNFTETWILFLMNETWVWKFIFHQSRNFST